MTTKDTGGPAFPAQHFDLAEGEHGLTIRDWFASSAPTDEVQELYFRHLSRQAQERITGLTCQINPQKNGSEQVDFQLEEFRFKCAVNAAIRYALADAMLKARQA